VKSDVEVLQEDLALRFYDCCAAERRLRQLLQGLRCGWPNTPRLRSELPHQWVPFPSTIRVSISTISAADQCLLDLKVIAHILSQSLQRHYRVSFSRS
jgi:hypothetical protein